MTPPIASATAHIPTVGLSIEMPTGVDLWDLVEVLADALDLLRGEVALDDQAAEASGEANALVTVASVDHTQMVIVTAGPDMVRLRLLVTAPDPHARSVLTGALDALTDWVEAEGVTGWRWQAAGCAGWHCPGSSCLAAPAREPAWWQRHLAEAIATLGQVVWQLPAALVAACALIRYQGDPPNAVTTLVAGWPYAGGDLSRGVPVVLAAYAASWVLDAVAALIDPPDEGRLAAVRRAAGPVLVALAGAALGWGWLG
jgi:hypothetical protein